MQRLCSEINDMTSKIVIHQRPTFCKCTYCWTFGWFKYNFIEDIELFQKDIKMFIDDNKRLLSHYKPVCKKCAVRLAI